ncbi:pyridoxal phosphate-dependent aminotransferase [Christiangramia portivictoriae]|uniref:pyridoxal phosphate-dependent aminotransferase n=1 Tax=Christiangramia portivictoriae TaxID=326069 RepID=UPI0003F510F0|nr:aminotransferase class I/II-fold pyridoxal phosphate-dependent enzyme [Christiangramia portivictoriae]
MKTAKRLESIQEYYFSKKLREVAALREQGQPVINLGIGSPDLAPPQQVVDAMQNGLDHSKAHQYQPYKGIPALRNAMTGFYARFFNVELDAENEILPLMGSKEGIMHISMAFVNKGDIILVPDPGYPTYTSVSGLLQAKVRKYELDESQNWLPDLEALEQQGLENVKIMWVNYPHMPTGTSATIGMFEKLTAFAEKHKILVVNDNPYSFIQNAEPLSILNTDKRSEYVMELNSLSKSFNMAGWRVGMLAGSAKNIEAVLKVKSNMDSGMFYPLQAGAVQALQLEEEWFVNLNKIYTSRKKKVMELVEALNCKAAPGQSGLFIWAKAPAGQSAESLVDELLYQKDLFVTPGFIFGEQGRNYVRFSLCATEEMIDEALKRIRS